MPHFDKQVAHWDCFLGVNLECAEFCLGSRGHGSFDDLGYCQNCTVVGWEQFILGAKEIATCSAVCL